MQRLQGRVAIVTGSTAGIGYAIVERFAAEGAHVVISSRAQENVDAAVALLKTNIPGATVFGAVCDVCNTEHRKQLVQRTLDEYGGIDIVVHNVAIAPCLSRLIDLEDTVWDELWNTNVKTVWQFAKETYPLMRGRKGANMLITGSMGGYMVKPRSPLYSYGLTKTALLGLTKALAYELADDGIRVNCLTPGFVKTQFAAPVLESEAAAAILSSIPMKRAADASEMGGPAAFLCSDDASYITGESVVASGGSFSRL